MKLFVYGSLRRGVENPHVPLFRQHARIAGTASVRGHLSVVNGYPSLVIAEDGDPVSGELFEIDDVMWDAVVAELDAYEGSAWRRERIRVGATEAWAYVKA